MSSIPSPVGQPQSPSSTSHPFNFSSSAQALRLASHMLTQFGVGRKHNLPSSINSIDFSSKGDSLICSTDEPDESIQLFHVASAQPKKSVFCKKSGCDLVKFTHHTNAVIVASKNQAWDDSIRYLSLHDNKYLRYFKGHRDRLTCLSMSPLDDSFLSASLDRTVRLWDLRTNVCQGIMHIDTSTHQQSQQQQQQQTSYSKANNSGKILVAHDPAGMVFAVACSPNIIKLFDSRAHDSGPFMTFEINMNRTNSSSPSAAAPSNNSNFFTWSSIKFSPDGKELLVTTTESFDWVGSSEASAGTNYVNRIILLDSYEGMEKQSFTGHEYNPNSGASSSSSSSSSSLDWSNIPFEASFSPDGSHVFAGSRSGNVHSWNTATGEPVAIWNGMNSHAPITAIQFCPTKMTLVTADTNGQMLWWIPTQQAITASQQTTTKSK